jgi:hypothetical protein
MSDRGDDGDGDEDEDGEWHFTLQDIREREAEAEAEAAAERRRRQPLKSGDPSLENALFVVLGALVALFVLSRLLVV